MGYSTNGDLEQLIEQITDVIVARLNGSAIDQAGPILRRTRFAKD